jgi:hypothetical protein
MPGADGTGTVAPKDSRTSAVMINPHTMPIAVFCWSGSIRLIGLLLAPEGMTVPSRLRIPATERNGWGLVRIGGCR